MTDEQSRLLTEIRDLLTAANEQALKGNEAQRLFREQITKESETARQQVE